MSDIMYIKISARVCENVYELIETEAKSSRELAKEYANFTDRKEVYEVEAEILEKLLPHLDGLLTDFVQKRI